MSKPRAPQTIAAANGIAADEAFGAVVPPIYLSSTFAFAYFEQPRGCEYTRTSNPSRDLLADTIAKLEGGVGAAGPWRQSEAGDLRVRLLNQRARAIILRSGGLCVQWPALKMGVAPITRPPTCE